MKIWKMPRLKDKRSKRHKTAKKLIIHHKAFSYDENAFDTEIFRASVC